MRLYELRGKSLDTLTTIERPSPRPGRDQVLVRMRAASLNYRDLLIARDEYRLGNIKRPLVPLSDGAGEVIEVGSNVTRISVGARVMGNFFQKWSDGPFDSEKGDSALGGAIDGVLAEEVVFEQGGVVELPQSLSFEEAATLPCAGLTAWMGLVVFGNLKAGETILAMGTGGVSIFALQIAKGFDARAIVTSSSDEKLERARSLGADATINYRKNPDWDARAMELTAGRGVDHLIEVGGAATLPTALRSIREGGHIALAGLLTGSPADYKTAEKNDRGVRVSSIYVGSTEQLRALALFVEKTSLRPVVDRVFAFDQVREAYEYLASEKHFGKLVIRI